MLVPLSLIYLGCDTDSDPPTDRGQLMQCKSNLNIAEAEAVRVNEFETAAG